MGTIKKEPNEPLQAISESPLIVLGIKKFRFVFSHVFVGVCMVFTLAAITIPVLLSGDYSAAFFAAEDVRISKKILFFYLSLIGLPLWLWAFIMTIRTVGDVYFYENRIVINALFSGRKIIIPYSEMHISQESAQIIITRQTLPTWSQPFMRIKLKYLDGVAINTTFADPEIGGMKAGISRWENSNDGPKALKILEERAVSFTRK